MYRYLFFLFICLGCQSNPKEGPTEWKTNAPLIKDMLGVNAGPNVDGFVKTNSLPAFIPSFRYFYLQEKDFPNGRDPSVFMPNPCPLACNDYACWNEQKSPFANHKYRLCNLDKKFFEVFVAWEAIGVKGKSRPWPDKWFTDKEWGADYKSRLQNAYQYTLRFLETMCPNEQCIIDVLEIGNEPWGMQCPGESTYHAIQEGVIDAFKTFFQSDKKEDWGIKLSTGAFQAVRTRSNLNDGIAPMVPEKFRPYYDYISLHAYARGRNGSTNATPVEGGNLSFYNRLKNMDLWRRENMPDAQVNLTEFGWNSHPEKGVGERKQINYLMQALLVAQRFGIQRTFLYELEDQPKVTNFNSMGLYENGNHQPKPVYHALAAFVKEFGYYTFQAVVEESQSGFEYEFVDNRNKNPRVVRFKGNYANGDLWVNGKSFSHN